MESKLTIEQWNRTLSITDTTVRETQLQILVKENITPIINKWGRKVRKSNKGSDICVFCPLEHCILDCKDKTIPHIPNSTNGHSKLITKLVQCYVCKAQETIDFEGEYIEGFNQNGIIHSGKWAQDVLTKRVYHKCLLGQPHMS